MKLDDLENRLRRTPRSEPPPAWRTEVLAAAREGLPEATAGSSPRLTREADAGGVSIMWQWLRGLLWPHPVAWACLLLLWLPVGVAELALYEPGTRQSSPPAMAWTPGQIDTYAAARRELLSELLGGPSPLPAEPTATAGPRSEAPRRLCPESAQAAHLLAFRIA